MLNSLHFFLHMEAVPSSKLPVDFYQSNGSHIMYLFSLFLYPEKFQIHTNTYTHPFSLCFKYGYTQYILHGYTSIHINTMSASTMK